MRISGKCDPRFQPVADAFERNFRDLGEVGASVCVTIEGETVVDMWGGVKNLQTEQPWDRDTISVVWSNTKGATSLCAHILASRGLLDIDAPVSQYWPEFAQAGKEHITVRNLLNHQAGLAAITKELPPGAMYDWEYMVGALAEQAPLWSPGTRNGYHMITFGWLVGEVVRRVSGKSLGRFFQDEVAGPLGLDFWIGLPEEMENRVAPVIMPAPDPNAPQPPPDSVFAIAFGNGVTSGYLLDPDSRAAHAAEIGGAGGITNARGLAGMYAPLANGGSLGGVTLVDGKTLARMGVVSSATGQDATLMIPTRFALGFMKSIDNRRMPPGMQDSAILTEDAFGHVGYGGSIGFASPAHRLSFGYSMNSLGNTLLLTPRGQGLVAAAYSCLGVDLL